MLVPISNPLHNFYHGYNLALILTPTKTLMRFFAQIKKRQHGYVSNMTKQFEVDSLVSLQILQIT